MKYGSSTWKCPKCNKEIVQNKYTWLMIDMLLHEIKIHYHCKFKHGIGYFTLRGIIKRWLILIPFGLINIITLILWLITYPFWILHELLG